MFSKNVVWSPMKNAIWENNSEQYQSSSFSYLLMWKAFNSSQSFCSEVTSDKIWIFYVALNSNWICDKISKNLSFCDPNFLKRWLSNFSVKTSVFANFEKTLCHHWNLFGSPSGFPTSSAPNICLKFKIKNFDIIPKVVYVRKIWHSLFRLHYTWNCYCPLPTGCTILYWSVPSSRIHSPAIKMIYVQNMGVYLQCVDNTWSYDILKI